MTAVDYMEHIKSDPAVCGGKPCIAGTRMRVRDILEYLAAGDTIDELLELYPYVSRDAILACLAFAADRADFPVLQAAE